MSACDDGVHVVEEWNETVCVDCHAQFCRECGDFLHGAEPCLADFGKDSGK